MLDALAKSVTEKAHELLDIKSQPEGDPSSGWLLVDLGDVVIHVFSPDQREYYQLEDLWEHGKVLLRLQ
jgi:ribosome-associated protein